ncbi:MAG: serine/threonine protein kinase [Candidatus Brocadiae bacterium]|nr:serine/threonine protein kinase [Candidatus Brocadiia bacterium]
MPGYMIGEYELVEKLGSGAMGDVFKGRNPKTNEFVAIKILSEELSTNPRAIERFKREIAQSIQLKHPNLIGAYSEGEFKGRRYYAMEYVEGVTAKKELLTRGPYDEFRVLEVIIQISKALEYAANQGIIHRDIKPDNIMITYDGKAKLCDMGLAKSVDSDMKVTVLGTVLGTPHYMSPEQARGDEDLDTRTDIFSLGATSYHLLTGSPPFEGSDPIAVMNSLLEEEPTAIQDRNPKVSDATSAVINKMMAKDRKKRYQNFTELLQDLYKLKRRELTSAQLSGDLPQSKVKQQKFEDCFVPSEEDVLTGQIAIHNKIIPVEKMEECLIRQESLALMGIILNLGEIMMETGIINPQQKLALDKTKVQFMIDRGDDLFFKVSNANNFLENSQVAEFQRLKKLRVRGIAANMVVQKMITEEKREKIYAVLKDALVKEEGKNILKAALENNILSKPQVEKCSRIYSNNIVMGKYRDLGEIILEKGFLPAEAYQALLRSVRRSTLTGKPASDYLNEIRKK